MGNIILRNGRWKSWSWIIISLFFSELSPPIAFGCIFIFGFSPPRVYYTEKYTKNIKFLVSSYSYLITEISYACPEVIDRQEKTIEYNDIDISYPEAQRNLSDEQNENADLLRKVLEEYRSFDKTSY
jgi:hypothetical protein